MHGNWITFRNCQINIISNLRQCYCVAITINVLGIIHKAIGHFVSLSGAWLCRFIIIICIEFTIVMMVVLIGYNCVINYLYPTQIDIRNRTTCPACTGATDHVISISFAKLRWNPKYLEIYWRLNVCFLVSVSVIRDLRDAKVHVFNEFIGFV